MKLLFADEVCGVSDNNLFGICLISIDSTKYKKIQSSFSKHLNKVKWPVNEELKGKYLFSNNPAGSGKKPEEMVELVIEIVNYLSSKTNSRCEVIFAYNLKKQTPENYIYLLSGCLSKIKKASKGAGKDITTLMIDNYDDLRKVGHLQNLNDGASNVLIKKGYILIDSHVGFVQSNNLSVGICYADIIAYICKWVVENPKVMTQKVQPSLFELYNEDVKKEIIKKKIGTTHMLANMLKSVTFVNLESR